MHSKVSNWIKDYALTNNRKALVVGISGGIDSSVVSTLCAMTKLPTHVVSMPIQQIESQDNLSIDHGDWLVDNFSNVKHHYYNLDKLYDRFYLDMLKDFNNDMAFANSKSRLRMVTLYQIAQAKKGIVVGTGNKVEDFGVGFYTKYGDGGVDIAPIADCTKTQVWEMGTSLSILKDIINAKPTDGLWDDNRNDEGQLGLTYKQIEEAMKNSSSKYYEKYLKIRKSNLHKMCSIPVCKFKES